MSALYMLKCNECGEIANEPSTLGVAMARANNRCHGWTTNGRGVDHCPACTRFLADQRAERRKADPSPGYY